MSRLRYSAVLAFLAGCLLTAGPARVHSQESSATPPAASRDTAANTASSVFEAALSAPPERVDSGPRAPEAADPDAADPDAAETDAEDAEMEDVDAAEVPAVPEGTEPAGTAE